MIWLAFSSKFFSIVRSEFTERKIHYLILEQSHPDIITNGGVKYYKVEIESLIDESFQIKLDGLQKGDVTFNEMYVKYGELPTLNNFDYAYDEPYSANQEIMIHDARIGTYYIMVKNNNQDDELQNISLYARLVGFELHSIDQTSGGNSGEITIKFNGTAFDKTVKPVLQQGVNIIKPNDVYYSDNTEVFATFDLRDRNYGAYDARIIKDISKFDYIYKNITVEGQTFPVPDSMYVVVDSLIAELSNTFTITSSNNINYLENIDIPEVLRVGFGVFESSVEIINLSNNDIIAPMYMLKSELASKLPDENSFTTGSKKFLVLSEDGPAGVIRPGESTILNISTRLPLIAGKVTYNIMKIQDSGFEFDFDNELSQSGNNKDNPELAGIINQIELEIGNSWKDYNRSLSQYSSYYSKISKNKIFRLNRILSKEIVRLQRINTFSKSVYKKASNYNKGNKYGNSKDFIYLTDKEEIYDLELLYKDILNFEGAGQHYAATWLSAYTFGVNSFNYHDGDVLITRKFENYLDTDFTFDENGITEGNVYPWELAQENISNNYEDVFNEFIANIESIDNMSTNLLALLVASGLQWPTGYEYEFFSSDPEIEVFIKSYFYDSYYEWDYPSDYPNAGIISFSDPWGVLFGGNQLARAFGGTQYINNITVKDVALVAITDDCGRETGGYSLKGNFDITVEDLYKFHAGSIQFGKPSSYAAVKWDYKYGYALSSGKKNFFRTYLPMKDIPFEIELP